MIFITKATDNVMTAEENAINYANAYVTRLMLRLGVQESEVKTPVSEIVQKLAELVALREQAAFLVGSDATAYLEGVNADDIYNRKYKIYSDRVKQIENTISYTDFMGADAEGRNKLFIGTIPINRA